MFGVSSSLARFESTTHPLKLLLLGLDWQKAKTQTEVRLLQGLQKNVLLSVTYF